ncbi:MAG: transposase [Acidobacteriota bacterium]|nr:MAG: transposase [Acidobacteriota bacterium]
MKSRRSLHRIPLPQGWTRHARTAILHAVSLASLAFTLARSRVDASRSERRRHQGDLDLAATEIALLKEELSIKDARWSRLRSRRRPHYTPVQRMRILQLKAARRWSCEQAARSFLIDEQTLRAWLRRVDEKGDRTLIQTTEPVNRYPDFVRYLVKQLKTLLPSMGKVRLAHVLARAGLHIGSTTIGRIVRETEPLPEDAASVDSQVSTVSARVITAKYPGQTWHTDLTIVPTWSGFWVPWVPFALPQSWPFCWWVGVVVDHFSRAVVGFAVFRKSPTSLQVQRFLDGAIRKVGRPPRYIITDKGRQFWCRSFQRWCRRRGIRPRFGAVGKYGSIAIVERFIRSMKNECTRRILVPQRLDAMRRELGLYVYWYNEHRPSMPLGGSTPREVHDALRPTNTKPRFEPRRNWPRRSRCAAPPARVKGTPGGKLRLVVGFLEARKHLPVVELRRVA